MESNTATAAKSDGHASPTESERNSGQSNSTGPARRHPWRWIVAVVVVLAVLGFGLRWFIRSIGTVSTDDAYVAGHVTLVAPRVGGRVARVFVEDNNRVRKGDLLVQLDKTPYQVQVDIAASAVATAKADVVAALAKARGITGQARSLRFALEHAIEDVDNQVALLRSRVATLQSQRAVQTRTQADYDRAVPLVKSGAMGKEEFEQRNEAVIVAKARVEEALQAVYQVRVSLGLPATPEGTDDLTSVPPDLDQTISTVRQAQAALMQVAAQLGVSDSFNKKPRQMLADFAKRDPQGDIDAIYAKLIQDAPDVRQAEAKVMEAERTLDQAKLNLHYTDIVAEIDGVVTRRNVNPGNNVTTGQALMAVRSITEIWIDANFKETQLSDLRIGQPVDIEVDMYGSRKEFKGRISGFTFGTGATLALLPPENATGNFVKVVQRLPVRIELVDYDPEKTPLFIGLSVTPTVHTNRDPVGADAGKVLQPYTTAPRPPATMPSTPRSTSGEATRPSTVPATPMTPEPRQ